MLGDASYLPLNNADMTSRTNNHMKELRVKKVLAGFQMLHCQQSPDSAAGALLTSTHQPGYGLPCKRQQNCKWL
jgi:hypothetical protein